MLRFRVPETTDLSVFLNVGERAAHDVESNLAGIGLTLENCDTVLDFGCGAGRTLRWLIQQFPHVRFYGADVDPQAIAWTKHHLPGAEFGLNSPTPPIGYPDASFDFVYIISVFTHLAFELQKLWLTELHRIIRPEGIVLFTVHGEHTWHWLSPDKLVRLRHDGFLFETSRKLQGILPDWYHTSFMTEYGVQQLLGQSFRLLAYNHAGMGYQDVVIAQRN